MGVCLRGKRACYNCGQEGHISLNCPNSKKNGCYTCRVVNHQARNCPKKGTEEGSGKDKGKGKVNE